MLHGLHCETLKKKGKQTKLILYIMGPWLTLVNHRVGEGCHPPLLVLARIVSSSPGSLLLFCPSLAPCAFSYPQVTVMVM